MIASLDGGLTSTLEYLRRMIPRERLVQSMWDSGWTKVTTLDKTYYLFGIDLRLIYVKCTYPVLH